MTKKSCRCVQNRIQCDQSFGKLFLCKSSPTIPYHKVITSFLISDVSISCSRFEQWPDGCAQDILYFNNQDKLMHNVPTAASVFQQSWRELTGWRCLQTIHRRMMVSCHREASRLSFLGPSHLSTWLWPLHVPPRYHWLTSMHRLNPFYPAAPWHHTFFEKVKIT